MRSLPTNPPQKEGSLGTIYLGGGTPSQLTIPQLRRIFDAIYIYNKVENDAEVTIEVNPDDVTPELAAALQQLPINRVSMGAQTFNDERLHFLRRRHSSAQVHQAVATLRQAGFQNISIDLMYGFPNQTLKEWQADIDEALQLNVEHISTYCLMYEEGTPLYRLLEQGKVAEIDEELERKMYFTLINSLESAGYEHYEISNFAITAATGRAYRISVSAPPPTRSTSRHAAGTWPISSSTSTAWSKASEALRLRRWTRTHAITMP